MRIEPEVFDGIAEEKRIRHKQATCPHTCYSCPRCGVYRNNLENKLIKENIALKITIEIQQNLIASLLEMV